VSYSVRILERLENKLDIFKIIFSVYLHS